MRRISSRTSDVYIYTSINKAVTDSCIGLSPNPHKACACYDVIMYHQGHFRPW